MTPPAVPPAPEEAERDLLLRVLGTLLREDVVGLRSRSAPVERADGLWLRLPADGDDGTGDDGSDGARTDALLLPVVPDGFQSVCTARLPLLVRESDTTGTRELTSCDEVLDALKPLADPADRPGFDAFAEECREALATQRLHDRTRSGTARLLRERYGADPAHWTGLAGGLAHDTLAARTGHPVYPTALARPGLGESQLRQYAPEFHPSFPLRWLAVPAGVLTVAGPKSPATGTGAETGKEAGAWAGAGARADAGALPACWPTLADLGLPELADTHLALPVHPLTPGAPLRAALRDSGLADSALLAERSCLEAAPTLSVRTVALTSDPSLHLKLPLDTATLGLRNRRTIKPGTLVDGAACHRLLEAVTAREPRFRATVLHADESVYAHAGHELLAVLCRRFPAGLDDAVVTPMAALLSEAPGGATVIDRLADRFYGGDPVALFDALLTLLLDWQTTLFAHGVALESHQQNISLVLDHDASGRTRLRLLLKDNDGPRLHMARVRASLGPAAPGRGDFDDARILTGDDGPLLALFTTITLHLCAGAYAFGLARLGRAPLRSLLELIRDRLTEAAGRIGTGPGQPGAVLRAYVLDAPELPVKAMVTAGTLLSKERSGAADVNKHYTTGPNYLRHPHHLGGIAPPPPHPRTPRIRWSR